MGEFKATTLDRLLTFANGRTSPERSDGQQFKVYGSNGVIGFANETNAIKDTIVIGRVGSYCGSLYFSKEPCWVTDNAIRANAIDDNCSRFLFYLLGTLRLNDKRAGSGQPLLNQEILKRIPASIPDPDEQLVIAEVLGALDEKIELNRQINETLEMTALSLFNDWFVHYGPSRAKMAGREPYLDSDIWALFPEGLDSEGRPKGWKSGVMREIIEVGPSEPMRRGDVAPYLDMAALPTQGSTADLPVPREYSSGTRFRNGDTLLARITPCLENGKTTFVQNLPANVVAWGSTEFIVMRSISPVPKAVSYLLAREPAFRRHAIQSMTGTSGRQRASASAISDYPVTIPPDDRVWEALGSILVPTFAIIAANSEESHTLATTRDLLLPKLMSGEVRIKEADKIVGDIT